MRGAAALGEHKGLARIDLTWIANGRVGGSNTLPFGAVAVMGAGDLPKRITLLNRNFSGSNANGGREVRDDQDRARLNELRIA